MTRPARQPSPPGPGPAVRASRLAAWDSGTSATAGAEAASRDSGLSQAPGASPATRDEAGRRRDRDARLSTLLAAAAAGDSGAFEAFYEATFAYARTVARRLLRDSAEIEDLIADCYFEAWRSANRFDPSRGSPVTWLLTLVRSRGVDALRAAAARPDRASAAVIADRHEGALAAEPGPEGAPDAAPGAFANTDPADELWRRQSGTALHAALGTLSAPERWVLGLAYLRELSQAEISRCTGMPLGTVKSHALRAQNKLRVLLAAGSASPSAPAGADGGAGQGGAAGSPDTE
jgi:RNA polymerase sigma-70 factor, ECF subfamily